MSISTRLTLILTLAAALLFGGVGYTSVRSDERELRFLVLRETTMLATSLELAFDDALRDRQLTDVQDTLSDLEHLHPEVDILVYDQHADLVTASEGALRREPVERAQHDARNSRGPVERFVFDEEGGRLIVALPLLRDRAEAPWVLAVVRPLDDMEKEMELKRRTATLSVTAFAVLVAILMFWLVRVHVGRPLAELVGDMRRVQGGDLSPRPAPTRHDEVGDALVGFAKLTHELREAKSRLDQEASERAELSRRLQEADKLVTIGQLSASLAQEIDSPLGVLEGRARDLFDHAKEPESIRSGGTLVEQAGRIRRIIGRLATLSRRPLRAHRGISPHEALSVVLELLNAESVRRSVRIHVDAERDLPEVLADPDQLEQVVLNLVRNALQATPDGGTVNVRLAVSELKPAANEEARPAIELTVSDNGHGMNAATRERVFDPFFTTRADVGATGLGLSVVKSIVDQHRGTVEIESELGSGTTVRVRLPAMIATERDAEQAAS